MSEVEQEIPESREPKRRRVIVAVGFATAVVAGVAIAVPIMFGSGDGGGGAPADAVPAPGQGWAVACAQATGAAVPPARPVDPSGGGVPARPMPADPPAVRPAPETLTATAVPMTVAPLPYTGPLPTPLPTDPPVASKPPPGTKRMETLTQYACPTSVVGPIAVPPATGGAVGPPVNVPPVHYPPEQLRQRGAELQAYLRQKLALQVPAAMEITPGEMTAGQNSLRGLTEFTVNGVRSSVELVVFAPGAPAIPPPGQECAVDDCRFEPAPDGGLQVNKVAKPAAGNLLVSVMHYRVTGTVVQVVLTYKGPESGTALADPAVSDRLVTVLATDPALGL